MAMRENSCRRKSLPAEEKNRVGVGRGVGSALSFTMRHGLGGGGGNDWGGGGGGPQAGITEAMQFLLH